MVTNYRYFMLYFFGLTPIKVRDIVAFNNNPERCREAGNAITPECSAIHPPPREGGELKIPTFKEMLDLYPILCEAQRKRTGGRPCIKRVEQVLVATRSLLKRLKWSLDRPYTDLTRKVMEQLFEEMIAAGFKPVSAKSYIEDFRGIGAKWTHYRYEEYGYHVTDIKLPSLYTPPNRYVEKPVELRKAVVSWYNGSLKQDDPDVWFFATMMLKFGMRNCDVKALTWDNFQNEEDGVYLRYTPNKTKLSSGRTVHWPVDDDTWSDILEYRLDHEEVPFIASNPNLPKFDYKLFGSDTKPTEFAENRLRKYLRELGFTGSKCAYELRKLCACTVYKNFGQEAASSLLGDDIDTILYHYADPSSVSKKVDVTKLI